MPVLLVFLYVDLLCHRHIIGQDGICKSCKFVCQITDEKSIRKILLGCSCTEHIFFFQKPSQLQRCLIGRIHKAYTISHHLDEYGSTRWEVGYASAISFVLFLMMIGSNMAVTKLLSKVGQ